MDKHYDHPRTTAQDLVVFNANPKHDETIKYNNEYGLAANTPSTKNKEMPKFRQVVTQGNGGKRRNKRTQKRRKRKGGKSKRRRRM
jgi:hypothetical protein